MRNSTLPRSDGSTHRDRSFRHRQSRSASCRPSASDDDRRDDRAAASARSRQAARGRLRVRQAALDAAVGPAGRGQDDARAPDGACVQRRVHRALGGALRRQGHPRCRRARRGDARAIAPAHDPVRRRGPPLQQGAAGRVPPLRRAGARHLHRRDDREPVVRGQQRAPVARGGLCAGAAVGGRARAVARPCARRGRAGTCPLPPKRARR